MWRVLCISFRTNKFLIAILVTYIGFNVILKKDIFSASVYAPNCKTPMPDNELKTILIWNSAHRIETAAFGTGREAFIRNYCEYNGCIIYTNQTALKLEDYDAIIIHMHEIGITKMPEFKRRSNQRLIFLTQETPASMGIEPSNFNGIFNWTMTYKRNSDVQLLYGRVTPRFSAPTTDLEIQKLKEKMHNLSVKNYSKNKKKLIAWMVSHCKTTSLREKYVYELMKYVTVDIYGACGNMTCPQDKANWISYPICYDMLESQYKFYLSFENSICNDYVTEKFFNILDRNIVPIVYGGANYSEIAPKHSYIDASEFTPEKLARYVKLLDANNTLYNEYFWWKEHYLVESGTIQMVQHGFCDLCKKLHVEKSFKVYQNIVSEWHTNYQCQGN